MTSMNQTVSAHEKIICKFFANGYFKITVLILVCFSQINISVYMTQRRETSGSLRVYEPET